MIAVLVGINILANVWESNNSFVIVSPDAADPRVPALVSKLTLTDAGDVAKRCRPPEECPNAYVAITSNGSPHFRSYVPEGGCGHRVKTSVTAKFRNCQYATNGGPFNMSTGACDAGISISNGTLIGTGGWLPSFGVTGNGSWIIGTMSAEIARAHDVRESIPGFSVLVKNGVNIAGNTSTFIAPRTTIGVNKAGQMVMVEVDGCEQRKPYKSCLYTYGKTEYAMAELLIEQGLVHAINLDGGGSSTVVSEGKVLNHPTAIDLWLNESERPVVTITCVL